MSETESSAVWRALRYLLPLRKKRYPFTGKITRNFEPVKPNRLFHPGVKAEWKENKPYWGRHVIQYGNGKTQFHYDLGNPRKGVLPALAYGAEEATRFGTAAAVGTGGYLMLRKRRV